MKNLTKKLLLATGLLSILSSVSFAAEFDIYGSYSNELNSVLAMNWVIFLTLTILQITTLKKLILLEQIWIQKIQYLALVNLSFSFLFPYIILIPPNTIFLTYFFLLNCKFWIVMQSTLWCDCSTTIS
jgi:hypothetical protein